MKSKRLFLEPQSESDSYVAVDIDESGYLDLKLADCKRSINWFFGKPGNKRAIRKIKKVKAVIDEVYAHLTGESA